MEKLAFLTKETASKRLFLNKIVIKCKIKLILFFTFNKYFIKNRVRLEENLKFDEGNSIKI